jgi:hypothetical protein
MKKLIVIAIASAAFLSFTATIAHAKVGETIQGTPVGLEHSPPDDIVAHALTNGDGNVTFNNLKPGHYSFVLTDTSTLKVPCRMAVTFGREKFPISEPILPGKRGAQAFALDRSGQKLFVVLEGTGSSITVHLQTDK